MLVQEVVRRHSNVVTWVTRSAPFHIPHSFISLAADAGYINTIT